MQPRRSLQLLLFYEDISSICQRLLAGVFTDAELVLLSLSAGEGEKAPIPSSNTKVKTSFN